MQPPRTQTMGTLAAREASFVADLDISERHGVEKRNARLRIQAKLAEYWNEYYFLPLLQTPGLIVNKKLTDEGGRVVRAKVVELLRTAPLNHGFKAGVMFSNTWDIGNSMKNCYHLDMGSKLRDRTEAQLFRYDGANATGQMSTHSHGGKDSPTFSANSRPLYAALNYSRAKYGGSSFYGKTHLVLRDVLRFNATFTHTDSFKVSTDVGDQSYKFLANYHNVYPLINNVHNGEADTTGGNYYDILKSMIDHALHWQPKPPDEEFDGSQYIEAQIPGDILYARDVLKVVVANSEYAPTSRVGKNLTKFAVKHNLLIKFC